MASIINVSVQQLRQAVGIKEQIERLQGQLVGILTGGQSASAAPARRTMSASARARIAAAQRARWARVRAGN